MILDFHPHRHRHPHSSQLHVVAVISNPIRYSSRFALYKKFEAHMLASNVNLITVEIGFGDRNFEVTVGDNVRHVQLRSHDEIWHKENMINLGMSILPHDWEYVAWVDADIQFVNMNWAEETVHALQHYMVVQPWAECIDKGPKNEVLQIHKSFCSQHVAGKIASSAEYGYGFPHPGFAWAARREAIEGVGGLIDRAILGAGDHHMAHALIGNGKVSVHGGVHPNYLAEILRWQDRALKSIDRDIGFVPGLILHDWHGKKKNRKYLERWSILIENQYDPLADIKTHWNGLYGLAGNKPKLRDDIRAYFRQRDEDSIDLE